MPVRMTGMISNMDTESLIKGMMDAQRMKNKKVTDKQTLLTWKQDKWKELNAKLYALYRDHVSNLRLQGSYTTRAVTSSNEAFVTATGTANATIGTQTLSVKELASAQFVTGSKITKTGADGKAITGNSKLVSDLGMADGTQIKIETAKGTKILDVDDTTTVDMFLQKCKDAGLNASYDTAQKRFFISSKSSGKDSEFQITTFTDDALTNKRTIDNLVNYSGLSSANKAKVDAAYQTLKGADATKLASAFASTEILDSDDADTKAIKNAVKTLKDLTTTNTDKRLLSSATSQVKENIKNAIENGTEYLNVNYAGVYDADKNTAEKELMAKYKVTELDYSDEKIKKEYDELVAAKVAARVNGAIATDEAKAEILSIKNEALTSESSYVDYSGANVSGTYLDYVLNTLELNIQAYSKGDVNTGTGQLSNLGLSELKKDSNGIVISEDSNVALVNASDSEIIYNGATITGTSNVITVNGLTLTLKGRTEGQTVSLNVINDTQKTYDMIKKFITSYNDILKEMNTLYNAASSRGYDPLSDDEKEAMTDDQIEKWETKIKDSILRRDSTLGSVIDAMRNALNTSVEVNGKKYSLSSYGIQTSNDYTERGLLHIAGDKDDSVSSAMEDKLMKALESDPDTVIAVLAGITKKLYDTMTDKMSSIPNVRSAYTFYNDKTMATQQTAYKKKIAELEDKLTEMEDKYYKQFAAMETALSKLQSQTNSLLSMMGTKQ